MRRGLREAFDIAWMTVLAAAHNLALLQLLRRFPLPLTVAAAQFGVGVFVVAPMWLFGARKIPRMSHKQVNSLLEPALWQAAAMALGTMALAGSHVGQVLSMRSLDALAASGTASWLSTNEFLIAAGPVVVGATAMAASALYTGTAAGALTMTALSSFCMGRGAAALRRFLRQKWELKVAPRDAYCLVTLMALMILLPWALLLEGKQLTSALLGSEGSGGAEVTADLLPALLVCGAAFQFAQEAGALLLAKRPPVSFAAAVAWHNTCVVAVACSRYTICPEGYAPTAAVVGAGLFAAALTWHAVWQPGKAAAS